MDLKSEREKKKISLAQIAADTRISLRYLQSIEEGRYNDLPGGIYNRAFIKAYCESINIDPAEVLDYYDAQAASVQSDRHPKTVISIPQQKKFPIQSSILIWFIMLLISAIGIYFSRGWISDLFSPYFSEKKIPDSHFEASNPVQPPPESSSPPSQDLDTSSKELPSGEPALDSPTFPEEPLESTEPAAETPLKEPEDPINATAHHEMRLEISAKDPCWISVDCDDVPKFREIMKPGDTQVFDAQKRLRITIGNAGGIQMKLNGKPLKPLGKPDEVIRININSENYQQFIEQPVG